MKLAAETSPEQIVAALEEFLAASLRDANGETAPIKPAHRIPFRWPPHPVSYDFHVLPSDWTGKATIELHGEKFDVGIARTASGIFGRIETLWNEAKGDDEESMMAALRTGAEPLFARQFAISHCLGQVSRFEGTIRDLPEVEIIKLLYCTDRDVAHEAEIEIEKHASTGQFTDALTHILKDRTHRHRRIAQWCVLDMYEDLPTFCKTRAQESEAIAAIHDLIYSAEDDFARTIYKAGVVLGGHICTHEGADALLDCLKSPSKYGRRSAIHALFHLAEWLPSRRGEIVTFLKNSGSSDPEPILRQFAIHIARDVESGAVEHVTEPVFPDEG